MANRDFYNKQGKQVGETGSCVALHSFHVSHFTKRKVKKQTQKESKNAQIEINVNVTGLHTIWHYLLRTKTICKDCRASSQPLAQKQCDNIDK
jgi:hypothetical protein